MPNASLIQTTISGVTGLQTALNAKTNTTDYYVGRNPILRRPVVCGYSRCYNQMFYTTNTSLYSAADTGGTSRIYYVANCDFTDPQLVFGNFSLQANTNGEVANTNAITVSARIEYNSTTYPVTFGGQLSITLPAGSVTPVTSDPISLEITSGSNFVVRTYVSVASTGNKWPIGLNAGAVNSGETVNYCQDGMPVSNATNATPIVVTTGTHGCSAGDQVLIFGVNGNTAANGTFYVNVPSGTSLSLYTDAGRTIPVAGTGAYTNGGRVVRLVSAAGSAGVDATATTGALFVNGFYCYGPLAIVGNPANGLAKKVVACWGDSIQAGQNAYADDGYNIRQLRLNSISYYHLAVSGGKLQGGVTPATRLNRMSLTSASTDFYSELSINDISGGTPLATLQSYILGLALAVKQRNVRTWAQTFLPLTDNGNAPASGQTPTATESVRTGWNDWIRDGCPYNTATGLAVAVGTTGATIVRCKVYNTSGTLVTSGTTVHPFNGGGTFDPCGAIEVNSSNVLTVNGGRWYCGAANNVNASDGTHPNTTTVNNINAFTWIPVSEFA